MGQRGPKPQSAESLKLRGSWRAKGRAEAAPPPTEEIPPPPGWLPEAAREHWTNLAQQAHEAGVLTDAHLPTLALLACALARYVELEARVEAEGPTVEGSQGQPVLHPLARARDAAWEQVLKGLREFGLTPATWSGVARADAEDGDKARFFSGDGVEPWRPGDES